MTIPDKATFIAKYEDGSEKIVVRYDLTSASLPRSILIEMSGNWIYVDADDVTQLCAFLQRAKRSIHAFDALEGQPA